MTRMRSGAIPPLSWASAARPRTGETACGDLAVVLVTARGALVAVVDGLGHGPHAATAAAAAGDALRTAPDAAPDRLLTDCHLALAHTRGAVVSVASIDVESRQIVWCGVGNVSGVILRPGGRRENLLVQSGVVGGRLPKLRRSVVPFGPGEVLIFASDGVRPTFSFGLRPDHAPQAVIDRTLRDHSVTTDDATVLALSWVAEPA